MSNLQTVYTKAANRAFQKYESDNNTSLTRVHAGLYILYTGETFVEFDKTEWDSGAVTWEIRKRSDMGVTSPTEWVNSFSSLSYARDIWLAVIEGMKN